MKMKGRQDLSILVAEGSGLPSEVLIWRSASCVELFLELDK